MPSPAELSRTFRAQLMQRDAAALARITQSYNLIRDQLRAEVTQLLAQQAAAAAAGQASGLGWLYQQNRLATLLAQVTNQINGFAQSVGSEVLASQAQAAQISTQQAAALIQTSFDQLNTAAVETVTGSLADQGPLSNLLSTLGAETAADAKRALVLGIGTGQSPAQISRQINAALDVPRQRALTIARTETLRTYRDSSLATYQANAGVLNGWIWIATLGPRCCAFCISMHGTWHPLDDPFASHPNCRCSTSPSAKTETQALVQSGSDWFAQQDSATQETILGPSKYRAYTADAITLEDLRGFRDDPVWGPVGYERSLSSVLGAEAQQFLNPG